MANFSTVEIEYGESMQAHRGSGIATSASNALQMFRLVHMHAVVYDFDPVDAALSNFRLYMYEDLCWQGRHIFQ